MQRSLHNRRTGGPTPLPPARELDEFRETVWMHYRAHGRDDLPWRQTRDPYRILVSEIMLQQTQVPRVIPKYEEFISVFPDVERLAAAPVDGVLRVWQGLGYNRRALALKRLAEQIVERHSGRVPADLVALRGLPGVGPATAAAVAAFAFDDAHPLLETNIRAAYLHHFFPDRDRVGDDELLPLVAATLDRDDPRNWYYALMDYGSFLKSHVTNPSRRSRHHAKQSPFEGSRRQLRARTLRAVLERPGLTMEDLAEILGSDGEVRKKDLASIASALVAEGFLEERRGAYFTAE
jgi:A/G-specific adenine glycosylase